MILFGLLIKCCHKKHNKLAVQPINGQKRGKGTNWFNDSMRKGFAKFIGILQVTWDNCWSHWISWIYEEQTHLIVACHCSFYCSFLPLVQLWFIPNLSLNKFDCCLSVFSVALMLELIVCNCSVQWVGRISVISVSVWQCTVWQCDSVVMWQCGSGSLAMW